MSPLLSQKVVNFLHETKSDFEDARLHNLVYQESQNGFQLTRHNEDFVSEGTLISPILQGKFAFDNIVFSWNAELPQDTQVTVEVQVKGKDYRWTPFFEMATFGTAEKAHNPKAKQNWAGYVDSDELKLEKPARQYRYRVSLRTTNPKLTPTLRLIGISYADTKHKLPVEDALTISTDTNAAVPAWVRDLNIPYRSQGALDRNISWRACHPTSLSMVLQYLGTDLPTEEVAKNVWDPVNRIYGNWPFNAGFAGKLGYKSFVIRCANFDPVKEEIAAGRPVIISIKYPKNALTNAPVSSTDGHIIVVQGFTKDGDPICNDPAGHNEEDGHVTYKKEELERAWLNHSGAAVLVQPRDTKPSFFYSYER